MNSTKSIHGALHILADVAEQAREGLLSLTSPTPIGLDAKQRSELIPVPDLFPSGSLISPSWKVDDNWGTKLASGNSEEDVTACYILMDMAKGKTDATRAKMKSTSIVCKETSMRGNKTAEEESNVNNVVVGVPETKVLKKAKKAKGGPHICDVCGKSYPMGQQLGGHKRAHSSYKKPKKIRKD